MNRIVVVDASVAVKWLLPERDGEMNTIEALEVLRRVRVSDVDVRQPPHWLAEVAAVITRLSPETAKEDVDDLCDLEFDVLDTREVYLTACELSVALGHHLFDTLYHAVALNSPKATLITADEQYYKKAEPYGHIILLNDVRRLLFP